MESITDKIYTAMIEEKEEFSNAQILKRFFRINFDDEMMAKKIVEPLLKDDARFKKLSDKTWIPVKTVPIVINSPTANLVFWEAICVYPFSHCLCRSLPDG